MQLWRFLMPSAIGFSARMAIHGVIDRIKGAPPLPLRVRDYVSTHATRGDPASVLATMDRFATEVRFLMNVGPKKGPLVRELLAELPSEARVLELGAFCGYSSILFASSMAPEGRVVSVELSPDSVAGARANVEFAGLGDRIEIIEGRSSQIIPRLEGPFDLVFLDHWKDLYKRDLQAIEANKLLHPGSIVVADNVGESFNPTEYLEYVRTCGRYESEHLPATVEYSTLPDAVEVSVFRP